MSPTQPITLAAPPIIMVTPAPQHSRPGISKRPSFNTTFAFFSNAFRDSKSVRVTQPKQHIDKGKGKAASHAPCQNDFADVCAPCQEGLDHQAPQGPETLDLYLPLLPYSLPEDGQGETTYPQDMLDKDEDSQYTSEDGSMPDDSLEEEEDDAESSDDDQPLTPSELRIMLEPLDRRPSGVAVPESYTPAQEDFSLWPLYKNSTAGLEPPAQGYGHCLTTPGAVPHVHERVS